jgi:hypothetical protein
MRKTKRRGGSVFAGSPAYSESNWGHSNHYGVNTHPRIFEQYHHHKTHGGRKRKRKSRRMRGGGWLMDERFNAFQPVASTLGQLGFSGDSAIRTLMGRSLGINPNPTVQF